MTNKTNRKKSYERLFDSDSEAPLSKRRADAAAGAIWDEYEIRFKREERRRKALKQKRKGNSEVFVPPPEKTKEGWTLSKNETSINFLRREIYALGLALIRNEPDWDVADLVTAVRVRPTTRPEKLDNVFHALFMTGFQDDERLSRQARWKLAKEAEYAHRHDVPPGLLCGFLYQSGDNNEIARKLASGYFEPAYFVPDGDDEED